MTDNGMGADLKHALRKLQGSPGFSFVAVLSLAVGIGANAALFGAVRALLRDPMPVERPEELHVAAWRRNARFDIIQMGKTDYPDPDGGASYSSSFSHPTYEAMRAAAPEGVQLFAFSFLRGVSVAAGDSPAVQAGGLLADGAYFDTLGVPMILGRPLTPADDVPGTPLVVVLGHGFWMRAFGGDPDVVARPVRVNGLPAEVVGVTARGFRGVSRGGFFPQTDITVPMAAQPRVTPGWDAGSGVPLRDAQDLHWVRVMVRVAPGAGSAPATAALTAAFRRQPSPANQGAGEPAEVRLLPAPQGAQPVDASRARLLYVLLGAAAIVLLVACSNLASLSLARGAARQREMAIRRALGSGRLRLVRLSLMEGAVLASAGTAMGLLMAFGTRAALGHLVAASAGAEAFGRIAAESALTPGVVVLAVLLGAGCALLLGILPTLRLARVDPMTWLRQGGSATPRLRVGPVLLSLQIAASVPLLVGSILLVRTVARLDSLELGFDPEGMFTFHLDPTYAQVPEEAQADLYLRVMDEVRRIPGVSSVSLIEHPPLAGVVHSGPMEIDGELHYLHVNAVGPDFLRAAGMTLLEGRMIGIQDVRGAPRVTVVNQRLVQEVFGGAAAVGRTLDLGRESYQIVGVVNDSRYADRRSDMPPTLFPSALQRAGWSGHVVVRTPFPVARLEPALREAVGRVSRDLPVSDLTSQEVRVAQSTARERLLARLMTAFGVFALLLSSIGLHGLVAYSVSRRTREIGIRVAVGARPGEVRWLMLRQVLVLCAGGLVVGTALAVAGASLVERLLYGVAPADPWAMAGASILLVAVALAASYPPARRASGVDPLVALRTD